MSEQGDNTMSDIPTATPLVEQLKDVPIDGTHLYQVCDIRHKNIPYGVLCHSAADKIERLKADAYEKAETLLCEMQGLRDELVEVKRERDEAREDAKRATYDTAHETIKVSTIKSHWIEAIRERDELMDKLQRLAKTLEQADEEYGETVGGKADMLANAIEEAIK